MTTQTSQPRTAAETAREPTDARDPHLRLAKLFDPGTLRPLSTRDAVGASVAWGRVQGVPAIAFCTDGSQQGGAIGLAEADRITGAIDLAVLEGCPVVGLWHSGGAKLSDGVEALHGFAKIFAATTAASGRVPQISLILGPAAGGAAYGPALTDIVVMAQKGKVFVTGPAIVRSVTGEEIDAEGLGGGEAHGRKSGVAHVVAASEDRAYAHTRALTSLLGDRRRCEPSLAGAPHRDLRELLPENPRRVYSVHPVITALLDDAGEHSFEELQPRWAPNIVVGLGRLAGGTVGVVANNPLRRGGCLDSISAEKASRFVRMCDALGIPLLVIVDVPGYLPGIEQEWGGVVRRGAKLLYAFSEAVVPRVTLVTRKSYGGAYIAMNSRGLGATKVFAWPDAEVAVMGAESAVGILHRRALAAASDEDREDLRRRLTEQQRDSAGGVGRGVELGLIDEIIDPRLTRAHVASSLAEAPGRRGDHGNIPL